MPRRLAVLAIAGLSAPLPASAWELAARVPEIVLDLHNPPVVPPVVPSVDSGPAPAESSTAAPAAPSSPSLRLVWIDPTSAALGTEAVVRPEVARLLREMGVGASWRRGDPHEIARAGELRVIFLDRAAAAPHGAPVLGATPASFVGEPFVWVHVPSVRAATGVGSERRFASLDVLSARRLGIGLARVIAHEVVHAKAPFLSHGRGLMSARLDRAMLTAASVKVAPEVGEALRTALLAAPAAPRASEQILAVESAKREP